MTDFATAFQRREFLRPNQIDDLAKYLRSARRGKSGKTISSEKGNTYVSYVASYLKWLANEVITDCDTPEIREMIATQDAWLLEKLIPKTGSRSARDQKTIKKHLPEKALEELSSLWTTPFTKICRSNDKGSRMRNIVMLRILYETGMRRGELLALKLKNFEESAGGQCARLIIERNHNDSFDSRVQQPVAKTLGRIVPVTPELECQLLEYITDYRSLVPNVGFDEEDSIFVTHRGSLGQGEPISISAFSQALIGLKKLFPALYAIYPHLFRHDWNYRFSKVADREKLSPEDERQNRETLMGWAGDSEMARKYNLRHIEEKSLSVGLKVAEDTGRRPSSVSTIPNKSAELALVAAHGN